MHLVRYIKNPDAILTAWSIFEKTIDFWKIDFTIFVFFFRDDTISFKLNHIFWIYFWKLNTILLIFKEFHYDSNNKIVNRTYKLNLRSIFCFLNCTKIENADLEIYSSDEADSVTNLHKLTMLASMKYSKCISEG